MKILEHKLFLDPNGYYKLEVKVDKFVSIPTETIYGNGDRKYIYGEHNSFVSYGIIDETGYKWSSRASVFNGMFGKKCMEIVVNDGCRYSSDMLVEEVLKLIPSDYYIVVQKTEDTNGNISEIHYEISNANHEASKPWLFKERRNFDGSKMYISDRLKGEYHGN